MFGPVDTRHSFAWKVGLQYYSFLAEIESYTKVLVITVPKVFYEHTA